ncbi:MAG: hypothetical protein K2X77_34065 [Candidatus Obscuribacterales bacterium]|jgi:hypothetical protein|nr:hypothetical protein [Candidatus Obscuribacterales bacterium]
MYESCGGNFHEGNSQSNGFHLIQEYFQQRSCKHCCRNYSSDGIELIREEPGMVVVKVGCSNCGQPLGIALVGMSGSGKATEKAANSLSKAYAKSELDDPPYPADWTKNDIQKFSGASRIGYDDVLDAHQFFSTLPDDWQKLLPKKPKRSGRQLSM